MLLPGLINIKVETDLSLSDVIVPSTRFTASEKQLSLATDEAFTESTPRTRLATDGKRCEFIFYQSSGSVRLSPIDFARRNRMISSTA